MKVLGVGDEEPRLHARAECAGSAADREPARMARGPRGACSGCGSCQARITPLREPFEVHTGWAFEVADLWGNVVGFTD